MVIFDAMLLQLEKICYVDVIYLHWALRHQMRYTLNNISLIGIPIKVGEKQMQDIILWPLGGL